MHLQTCRWPAPLRLISLLTWLMGKKTDFDNQYHQKPHNTGFNIHCLQSKACNLSLSPSRPSLMMNCCTFNKVPCFKRLLNSSSPSRKRLKMDGLFYRFRRYPTPHASLDSNHIRSNIQYCSYIWAGAALSTLFSFNRVQKSSLEIICQHLFPQTKYCHPLDILSLLLDKWHWLIPPVQTFTLSIQHGTYTKSNHLHVFVEEIKTCLYTDLPPSFFAIVKDW